MQVEAGWTLQRTGIRMPAAQAAVGRGVFTVVRADANPSTGNDLHALPGAITGTGTGSASGW